MRFELHSVTHRSKKMQMQYVFIHINKSGVCKKTHSKTGTQNNFTENDLIPLLRTYILQICNPFSLFRASISQLPVCDPESYQQTITSVISPALGYSSFVHHISPFNNVQNWVMPSENGGNGNSPIGWQFSNKRVLRQASCVVR